MGVCVCVCIYIYIFIFIYINELAVCILHTGFLAGLGFDTTVMVRSILLR